MNPQMKRGFLEACVLAVLSRGESYGYQIVKDAPPLLELTESTLYPVLKRLEGAELIAARSAEHNGRLRRYYRITPDGAAHMRSFIAEKQEVLSIYRFVEQAADRMEEVPAATERGGAPKAQSVREAAVNRTCGIAALPAIGTAAILEG